MKTLIYFIGRFIRIFHRNVAMVLIWMLCLAPVLLAGGICLYFGLTAIALVAMGVVTGIVEFLWLLNIGIWWEEAFPRQTKGSILQRR